MAMTVGELVAFVRADNSDFERNLARSQLRMEGFRLDTSGRLRDLSGRFITESEVMGRALRGVGDDAEEAARQTVVYSSAVDREMRTVRGHFQALSVLTDRWAGQFADRAGRMVAGLRGLNVNLGGLGALGGRLASGLLPLAKPLAMLGAAVPAAAGLAAALAQMAPAAALAAPAIFGVVMATQALKLGMKGVSDAVSAAMDPSDPEAYAEALKKLAPNAQAFVKEVRALQPELKALQQGVQERLFQGLDGVLRGLGQHTLPILRNGLTNAAGALNLMGHNLGNTAIGLSTSGTLGRAISGANVGLYNLSRVPSQIVQGLTQVGAAAAPAFGRLTAAAGASADRLSERMSRAFESGAMERAIDQAIAVARQLGHVLGNVGAILGSVFRAAQASGGGFLGVLEQVTGSLRTAFASPEVQSGLKAIFETMATLARTIGPLLGQALGALAPVLTALGPPIQRLIGTLGAALGPVIAALGPVLEVAAVAVGALLDAISPLLPVVGQLVAGLLPALAPLLTLVASIFKQLAPLVGQVAGMLASALAPVLAALVPAIQPIVDALGQLVAAVLPIMQAQIAALAPVIAQLAGIFARLLVALAPVIANLILLAADVLVKLTPAFTMAIGLVGRLAAALAGELGRVIQGVVVPALNAVAALLRGDFSGAWAAAKQMVSGAVDHMVRMLVTLPSRAAGALASLGSALAGRVLEAGSQMISGARARIDTLLGHIRNIPGMARSALGSLGSVLWSAGSSLISGLIDGVQSRLGALKAKLNSVTDMIPDWKGPADRDGRLLTPAGRLLMDGLMRGIDDRLPDLRGQLGSLTGALPGMALGATGASGGAAAGGRIVVEVTGPDEVKAFIRNITYVDGGGSVQRAFGY